MKLTTCTWEATTGWSAPLPELDGRGTLVLAFAARLAPLPGPLPELRERFPEATIVGCSTSGQIHAGELVDDAWVVAVASFEHVRLHSARAAIGDSAHSFDAGADLGRSLRHADPGLRAVFVLSDGLTVNGSALVRGIRSEVAGDVVVSGGLAGDADRFESTWIVDGAAAVDGAVVAVGFGGDSLRVSSASEAGWAIFGPETVITRSDGHVLYELDGKPALELYKQYLGELASELPASALRFPLAIRADGDTEQIVRSILAVDETTQSMTFAGDVPQGWRGQLMRANADHLVDGAEAAASRAGDDARDSAEPHGPTLAIAISCVGRRLVMGTRTEEEIEATLDALPAGTELVGFYSYGEIGPGRCGGSDLHNQTMTITTFSED